MTNQLISSKIEKLLELDSNTKSLIFKIENICTNGAKNTKRLRDKLEHLQSEVKDSFALINSILDELESLGYERRNLTNAQNFNEAVTYNKKQLLNLQACYRKSVFTACTKLELLEKDELISQSNKPYMGHEGDLEEQFKESLELTKEMTTYARLLSGEVERGTANTDLLEASSTKISSNYLEHKEIGSHLTQSKHLTALAKRRKVTGHVMLFLTFAFFFLSCASIFLHRIPLGTWFLPSSYF